MRVIYRKIRHARYLYIKRNVEKVWGARYTLGARHLSKNMVISDYTHYKDTKSVPPNRQRPTSNPTLWFPVGALCITAGDAFQALFCWAIYRSCLGNFLFRVPSQVAVEVLFMSCVRRYPAA